mmetsp:Transcript_34034/g.67380  ORF Transcript_34034/g.67380 Transcript_34034/m.67380 type:complete len:148 (+) Transcript_34034:657-1100(+)
MGQSLGPSRGIHRFSSNGRASCFLFTSTFSFFLSFFALLLSFLSRFFPQPVLPFELKKKKGGKKERKKERRNTDCKRVLTAEYSGQRESLEIEDGGETAFFFFIFLFILPLCETEGEKKCRHHRSAQRDLDGCVERVAWECIGMMNE